MSLQRGDVVEIHGATGPSAPFNGLKAIVVNPDRDGSSPFPGWASVLCLTPAGASWQGPDNDYGYFKPEWLRKLDTTVARIEEPSLWGVVEADWDSDGIQGIPRAEWMHVKGRRWQSAISAVQVRWSELKNPVLVRPGLDD